jgi:large-conductance mechanosensitive channel
MRPSMPFRNKKERKGVSVSSDAQTTSDIFVCVVFCFVLFFCSCFLLFFLVHLHNKTRRMSREKPTSQKEEEERKKGRSFFFF